MASIKETQLRDRMLAIFQNSAEFRNSIPQAVRPALNQIIEKSIETRTPELVTSVETQSNQQLNEIPNKLIGVKNPVDIVAGNLSTNQLNDVIETSIGPNVTNDFSGKLSSDIIDDFRLVLPPQFSSTINFNLIKTGIDIASRLTAETAVKSSINQYSTQTLSGEFTPSQTIPDIDSLFTTNPTGAFQQVNDRFDGSISSASIREARNFDTRSAENEEKLITQTVGFIDPSATFPTKEYSGISEVNKLAQGDVNGTVVQTKEKERTVGVQLPNNESWEQPQSPYKGEYPYNKVTQTESGHIIEIDDTPGCERIHVYHKSGTFIEIDSNGTVVRKTKGSSYEIIEKNGYISVTGTANLSVKGSIKVFVGGDADIEVEGDTNIKCLNDVTVEAAGVMNFSATEELNLHSANVNIEADVNLNIKGDINTFITSTDIYMRANSNMFTQTFNNYNLLSGGSIFNQTAGTYNIKSASDTNVDGSRIYMNSGTSAAATASKLAQSSNIGLIGQRKDIIKEDITDPAAPNFLDKFGYNIEDSEFDSEAIQKQKEFRQQGILSDEDLDQTLAEIERDIPVSRNSEIVMPSDFVLQQTYLPDNYQLSKNFTLAMLSSKAVVTNNPVRAQVQLSYGEIVYNLQGIVLNICEPILALYPNMFVTSAFRLTSNSASTSDHPKGKAVDIQFRNVSKSDYFDIAKKLATYLNYDKLLLEYKTYGTGLPWIHISFDITKQRKIVLTYFNDKKFGDGLISLA